LKIERKFKMALTFKPAAGSIVQYQYIAISKNYLITGYGDRDCNRIANLYDLDTGNEDIIIVEFVKWGSWEKEFNNLLTVIG
jgi:hypothetical protein